jgi:hypothetical protein
MAGGREGKVEKIGYEKAAAYVKVERCGRHYI